MNNHLQFSNAKIDCKQSHYHAGALRERHHHDTSWVVSTFRGSCSLNMRSAENLLTPKSLVYVPAGEAHSNVFGSQGAEVFVIAIDPAWTGDRLDMLRREIEEPRTAPSGMFHGLVLKIYREFQSPDALSDLIVEGSFLELIGRWMRRDFHNHRSAPAWLQRVKAYLQDSFREPISLAQVAHAAGVHPSHVSREFHRAYGVTIGEYLRTLRVESVAQHLAHRKNPASLTNLALEAGFSSHAHMTAVFNRVMGMSPSQYRRAHGLGQSVDRKSIP